MHYRLLFLPLFLVAASLRADDVDPVPALSTSEEGFLPLFDGKLLANWEGNAYWFRVDEKAIVAGRVDEAIPQNFFLCTTKRYEDFELRLSVRVVGEGVNSGIQFRTKRIPASEEVSGYQADVGSIGDRSIWGALYDESRRNRMLVEPDAEMLASVVREDDWNDFVIRCVGPNVEIFVNGVQTVDYTETDPEIDRAGVIAVQIHAGPPSEAWFRDLRIKPL